MNNSITNNPTTTSSWKRTRTHYIAAAAGLALSVSAFVALGSTSSNTQPSPSASPAIAASSATTGRDAAEVTFYLVSSQAQADYVRAMEEHGEWIRVEMRVLEPNHHVMILNAATASEEAQAQDIINDAMAASNFSSGQTPPSFHIVDFRTQ